MRKSILIYSLLTLISCSGKPVQPNPDSSEVGIDPTFTWDNPTTDCAGGPAGTVTANVYCVTGTVTTFPTRTIGTGEVPCGARQVVDTTAPNVTRLNTTPISGTSYFAVLAAGNYTCAVELVNTAGLQGSASAPMSFSVVSRPNAPTNIRVSWIDEKKLKEKIDFLKPAAPTGLVAQ